MVKKDIVLSEESSFIKGKSWQDVVWEKIAQSEKQHKDNQKDINSIRYIVTVLLVVMAIAVMWRLYDSIRRGYNFRTETTNSLSNIQAEILILETKIQDVKENVNNNNTRVDNLMLNKKR